MLLYICCIFLWAGLSSILRKSSFWIYAIRWCSGLLEALHYPCPILLMTFSSPILKILVLWTNFLLASCDQKIAFAISFQHVSTSSFFANVFVLLCFVFCFCFLDSLSGLHFMLKSKWGTEIPKCFMTVKVGEMSTAGVDSHFLFPPAGWVVLVSSILPGQKLGPWAFSQYWFSVIVSLSTALLCFCKKIHFSQWSQPFSNVCDVALWIY